RFLQFLQHSRGVFAFANRYEPLNGVVAPGNGWTVADVFAAIAPKNPRRNFGFDSDFGEITQVDGSSADGLDKDVADFAFVLHRRRILTDILRRRIRLPREVPLSLRTASTRAESEPPKRCSWVGWTRPANCLASPPKLATSPTPGTRSRRGVITQSCNVRRS